MDRRLSAGMRRRADRQRAPSRTRPLRSARRDGQGHDALPARPVGARRDDRGHDVLPAFPSGPDVMTAVMTCYLRSRRDERRATSRTASLRLPGGCRSRLPPRVRKDASDAGAPKRRTRTTDDPRGRGPHRTAAPQVHGSAPLTPLHFHVGGAADARAMKLARPMTSRLRIAGGVIWMTRFRNGERPATDHSAVCSPARAVTR